MTELLISVHLAILIGFTIRILLRDDLSPQARLAWFILIAALPYVGSAIYFLFGEIDLGHHTNKRHREVLDQIHSKAAPLFGTPAETDRLIDPLYSSAFR